MSEIDEMREKLAKCMWEYDASPVSASLAEIPEKTRSWMFKLAEQILSLAEPVIRQDERRKVVEWLEARRWVSQGFPYSAAMVIGLEDWQALRREAGLGG
jgi:hypothetical protein